MIERYCPPAPIESPADLIDAARERGVVELQLGETIVTVQCTRDVIDIRARDATEGCVSSVHMVAATNRSAEQFDLPIRTRILHLALGTSMRHTLSPQAQPGFRAGRFIHAAIDVLEQNGPHIEYCEARWMSGTNLKAFDEARMAGATLIEAAASTWTARQLAKSGFDPLPREVRTIGRRTDYSNSTAVYALFPRSDESSLEDAV